MHILFLTDNFPPESNAIANRVYERACYWIQWGHQVTVITSCPNFPEGKIYPGYQNKFYQVENIDGIRVVRVKTFITQNKGFFLRIVDFISYIFPALFAGMWQKKPDVVVATTPQFFVGITGWLLSRVRRKPFVLEVADIWPASIVGVGAMRDSLVIRGLEKIELFLYRRAKKIVALTESFKKNLVSRGIDADKITVVINGVDLTRYAPVLRDAALAAEHHFHPEAFVIGYIGTHGMAHALKNVLYAAEKLKSESHIRFLFVGAGAERDDLMVYAVSNRLTNVTFIPAQSKQVIKNFWSLCDIALVHLKNDPVFSEVIPSKIFEAMGMELPILLAAPPGEASDLITREAVGLWVPAEDPEALQNAIQQLYQQPEQRKQFAQQGRQRAYFYSRERQAKEMIVVMEDMM